MTWLPTEPIKSQECNCAEKLAKVEKELCEMANDKLDADMALIKMTKERDTWKNACGINAESSQILSDACEKAEKERDAERLRGDMMETAMNGFAKERDEARAKLELSKINIKALQDNCDLLNKSFAEISRAHTESQAREKCYLNALKEIHEQAVRIFDEDGTLCAGGACRVCEALAEAEKGSGDVN